jgi:hypothetical protein
MTSSFKPSKVFDFANLKIACDFCDSLSYRGIQGKTNPFRLGNQDIKDEIHYVLVVGQEAIDDAIKVYTDNLYHR